MSLDNSGRHARRSECRPRMMTAIRRAGNRTGHKATFTWKNPVFRVRGEYRLAARATTQSARRSIRPGRRRRHAGHARWGDAVSQRDLHFGPPPREASGHPVDGKRAHAADHERVGHQERPSPLAHEPAAPMAHLPDLGEIRLHAEMLLCPKGRRKRQIEQRVTYHDSRQGCPEHQERPRGDHDLVLSVSPGAATARAGAESCSSALVAGRRSKGC